MNASYAHVHQLGRLNPSVDSKPLDPASLEKPPWHAMLGALLITTSRRARSADRTCSQTLQQYRLAGLSATRPKGWPQLIESLQAGGWLRPLICTGPVVLTSNHIPQSVCWKHATAVHECTNAFDKLPVRQVNACHLCNSKPADGFQVTAVKQAQPHSKAMLS
jgi:hypothetical protein